MKTRLLLGIGGAHVDRRGQVGAAYVPSVSNPGTMREETGGGVFNALRSSVQRGVEAMLLSVRGGDLAGAAVSEAVLRAGIRDLSATFLDRGTPSYTALLDEAGHLIAGLADMTLYEQAFTGQLRQRKTRNAIAQADALLIDANIPATDLRKIAELAGTKPIYAIAISPAKVGRLETIAGSLQCLFMNRHEAAILCGRSFGDAKDLAASLASLGLGSAIVTDGSGTILGYDHTGAFALDPPDMDNIADVTGAGDAMAGAFVAAHMQQRPFQQALREGVAASLLALESPGAVPELAEVPFERTLARVGSPLAL